MPDRITKRKRSELMSKIKGKNTLLEISVFRALRKDGVYFQRHYRKAPGSPDLAWPKKKIAVFIEGDFWHGYRFPIWGPRLNSEFWKAKIERNRNRDKRNFAKLRRRGWLVMRVWEHEIKDDLPGAVLRIERFIRT